MMEEENLLETVLLLEQFYKLPFTHKSYMRNCLFNTTIDRILIYFSRVLSLF